MFSNIFREHRVILSSDDIASAINLAFFLELSGYRIDILKSVSEILSEPEKRAIYDLWLEVSPATARAWLCMAEYEGRLFV